MGEKLTKARLVFSHCHACAENDDGEADHDPGVGCPADGPAEGCEAVWIEETAAPTKPGDPA